MSTDFQLAWDCPHISVEEVATLAEDRRTLQTRQPVNNNSIVRVLTNDEMYLSRTGTYSRAQIVSSNAAPFTLVEGESTMTLQAGSTTTTVALPIQGTMRLTAERAASMLEPHLPSGVVVYAENGFLYLEHARSIRVTGGLATALGFTVTTGATRKQLYPAWTIIDQTILFLGSVKNNPVFKVNYSTDEEKCLRCQGIGKENDARYDILGGPVLIDDENLLYQSCLKIMLTRKGSNPFHLWYGSSIMDRIGTKFLSGIVAAVGEEVRLALSKLQKVQDARSKIQQVTLKERLHKVVSVKVSQHETALTTLLVDVAVQNASGEPIDISIIYTAPGARAIAGTNGLSLG